MARAPEWFRGFLDDITGPIDSRGAPLTDEQLQDYLLDLWSTPELNEWEEVYEQAAFEHQIWLMEEEYNRERDPAFTAAYQANQEARRRASHL